MSVSQINRVFIARLAGTAVFDPNGDPVGKVRDAVATLRSNNQPPRILGLVVEVPLRRRVFVPITRVTSIESGAVVITGLVNMRRFEARAGELLVLGELLDRSINLIESGEAVVVEDMGMEQTRTGDWFINRVHIMKKGSGLRRKGATSTVQWEEVTGFALPEHNQGVTNLLSTISNLRAADLAAVIQDLAPKRRVEVARALDDERLADVLQEMDEAERVALLAELEGERAADVLGEMDYSVADALASVRAREVSPALASQVFVCRQPLETPTGRYIGMVHYQRLLREPPSTLLGSIVDTDTQGLNPNASLHEVSSYLASYNLLSVPVVDANERLLGAVTVDDVLDHLLPENWRLEHRDSTRGTGPKLNLSDVAGSEVSEEDLELDNQMEEEAR